MYRNFCIVLVLFVVSKFTLTVAGPVNVLHAMKHCREAHNISDERLRQIFINLSHKLTSEMNDLEEQCFVACYLEQTQILKSDGTVDPTDLINTLPQRLRYADGVAEEFIKCADQPGEGCEKKYKIAVCIAGVEDIIKFRKSGEKGKQSEAQ